MRSNFEYNDRNIDIERNLEDIGWTRPTDEEFSQWIEMGEKKRARRNSIARTVGTFALIIGLCAVFSLAGTFTPENATADPDDSIVVESGMETIDTYTSQEELPDDVKEKFLLFPEMPEGYEVTEVTHQKLSLMEMFTIQAYRESMILIVEETLVKENAVNRNVESVDGYTEVWNETEVIIKEYVDEEQVAYSFTKEHLAVRILVDIDEDQSKVKAIIKKAVL